MKANELRALSIAELQAELEKQVRQGFNFKVMQGSKQTVKPHLFKQLRGDVARIKTIMGQKIAEEGK